MFKRIVWFGSGVASGAAGSWYVKRKVREKVERFTPAGIRSQATERVQQLGATIRTKSEAAVTDGREVVRRYRHAAPQKQPAEREHLRAVGD